jgi:DNA topoisomerase-3
LLLIAKRVLCAVCKPHRYTETVVQMMCREVPFTAKGKTVLEAGWKKYADHEQSEASLPELSEGDVLIPGEELVKEGKTTPPKRFTRIPCCRYGDGGRKGYAGRCGASRPRHPATRAAILEKLVNTGFVERKKQRKPSASSRPYRRISRYRAAGAASVPLAHRAGGAAAKASRGGELDAIRS